MRIDVTWVEVGGVGRTGGGPRGDEGHGGGAASGWEERVAPVTIRSQRGRGGFKLRLGG